MTWVLTARDASFRGVHIVVGEYALCQGEWSVQDPARKVCYRVVCRDCYTLARRRRILVDWKDWKKYQWAGKGTTAERNLIRGRRGSILKLK